MNPKIYTRNYLDRYSYSNASSQWQQVLKACDNRPESYTESMNADTDGTSIFFDLNFYDEHGNLLGYSCDTILLMGINLKKFYVAYYTGTQWSTPGAWSFTTNALANVTLSLSPATTIRGIRVSGEETIIANQEKRVSEVYAGLYKFDIENVLAGSININTRSRKMEDVLADGTYEVAEYRGSRRIEFRQQLRNVPQAVRDNLHALWVAGESFGYRPESAIYPGTIITVVMAGQWNEQYNYKTGLYEIELNLKGK